MNLYSDILSAGKKCKFLHGFNCKLNQGTEFMPFIVTCNLIQKEAGCIWFI